MPHASRDRDEIRSRTEWILPDQPRRGSIENERAGDTCCLVIAVILPGLRDLTTLSCDELFELYKAGPNVAS